MPNSGQSRIVTAAMLAIGDELLSGRTRDKNIGHLAGFLTVKAIDLKEVRIVPDQESEIVAAVNALRKRHDLVFTSGGIGPTHDDITADAIAKAFGVPIDHDPHVMKMMGDHYRKRDLEFTTARKRMARMPRGAHPIPNSVSVAPGFIIDNVYVMAGVPAVFQAMLEVAGQKLTGGLQLHSDTIECPFGEGTIGDALGRIQNANPETSIGSYPRFDGKTYSTQIVIRSRDKSKIRVAATEIREMLRMIPGP